jgi:hypothetical protein
LFQRYNAKVEFHPVMLLEDLKKAIQNIHWILLPFFATSAYNATILLLPPITIITNFLFIFPLTDSLSLFLLYPTAILCI